MVEKQAMSSELKRCPFCGGEAKIERYWYGKFGVECADENCDGFWNVFSTRQEATAAWNARAERTTSNSGDCECCGYPLYSDRDNYCSKCGARVVGD